MSELRERKWAEVPGWPGYRVSDDGVVQSCKTTRGELTDTWRVKSQVTIGGYRRVELNNRRRTFQVHVSVLVLTCHGPRRPPGNVMALHGNGNCLDNRLENLRWGFADENAQDRDVHGTTARNERHGSAKLTSQQVEEIRRRRNVEGASHLSLAKEFGVSRSHVSKICRGLFWSQGVEVQR